MTEKPAGRGKNDAIETEVDAFNVLPILSASLSECVTEHEPCLCTQSEPLWLGRGIYIIVPMLSLLSICSSSFVVDFAV